MGNETLKQLREKLAAYAAESDVPEEAAIGEIVCTLQSRDKTWQHARIVGMAKDTCSLHFVNTGVAQMKLYLRSLPLDSELCLSPALAIRAQLDDIERLSDALVSLISGVVTVFTRF